MPKTLPKILLVDDEPKFLNSIAERLKLMGFNSLKASGGSQALTLARKNPIDLAIVDLKMPDMDGLVTITKLKEIHPGLKSILLTGYGSEKVKQATEALDAFYVEKDHMQEFWEMLKKSSQSGSVILLRPPATGMPSDTGGKFRENGVGTDPTLDGIGGKTDQTIPAVRPRMIGETLAMQELRRNIERLAALDCTAIIRGETGTGKELTARIIHGLSSRRQHRFIAVNCGCLSSDLLIEEIARTGQGAASGDWRKHDAGGGSDSNGTILLDQIEDMSSKMQLSMLKIIDSKEVSLQDEKGNFPFDARILAASRYSLRKLVEEGKFREELYYRLNVLELYIPPLRDRKDDIPPLCGFFLDRYAKEFKKEVENLSDDVIDIFMNYHFPGNVRELEHIIERAVILADGNTITPKHLPERFKTTNPPVANTERTFSTLAEMEKQYILEVMAATGGNKTKATAVLGISRAALWRKLKKFEQEDQPPTTVENGRPKKA